MFKKVLKHLESRGKKNAPADNDNKTPKTDKDADHNAAQKDAKPKEPSKFAKTTKNLVKRAKENISDISSNISQGAGVVGKNVTDNIAKGSEKTRNTLGEAGGSAKQALNNAAKTIKEHTDTPDSSGSTMVDLIFGGALPPNAVQSGEKSPETDQNTDQGQEKRSAETETTQKPAPDTKAHKPKKPKT